MNRPTKRIATIVLGLAVAALMVTASVPTSSPTPTASAASADYFLKLDGIDGEADDANHPGAIQIESWSWGVTQMGTGGHGGGGGAGKASFSDLSVMKRIDKSTPLLAKACATGEHIKNATLIVTRKAQGGTEDYYKLTLSDVTCTSLQQAGTGSDAPSESVTFTYDKIEMAYLPKKSKTWLPSNF